MNTLDRILKLIAEEGVNQKILCDAVGLNKTAFSDWKSGKSKSYVKYIDEIADFFKVSADYLLCRTDDPTDYDDGDFLADLSPSVLERFGGNARKARAFSDAQDKDALSDPRPWDNALQSETSLQGIEFALFGEVKDLTEAQKRDVLNFAKYIKSQNKKD
jgi:transcriptional regulator with XRE-family HTH domain